MRRLGMLGVLLFTSAAFAPALAAADFEGVADFKMTMYGNGSARGQQVTANGKVFVSHGAYRSEVATVSLPSFRTV